VYIEKAKKDKINQMLTIKEMELRNERKEIK